MSSDIVNGQKVPNAESRTDSRPSRTSSRARRGAFLRNKRLRQIFRLSKENYKNAKALVPHDTKDNAAAIRRGLRYYSVAHARCVVQEKPIRASLAFLGRINGIVVAGAIFLTEVNVFGQGYIDVIGIEFLIGSFAAMFLILLLVLLSKLLTLRKALVMGPAVIAILLLMVAILLINPKLNKSWDWITYPYVQGTAGKTAYILFFAVVGMLAWTSYVGLILYITAIAHRLVWRRYPNLILLESLIRIVRAIDGRRVALDLSSRARISSYLEHAAQVMKRDVPKAMSLPDLQARVILQEKCDNAAANLRIMQVAIALTEENALEHLKRSITTFIGAIAVGNYSTQPNCSNLSDVQATVPNEGRVSHLVRIGKIVTVAVIPIAFLVIARFAGLQLSEAFNNWAVVISLLWAAITIISVLDPLYKSRIEEVKGIIPFIGNSQK